jgi:ribonucleoside-diphosphate reductase alpha chain
VKTVRARDLFRQIAKAAWECADPGMQFDTTINRWHTAPETGRINGSNPCFPGDALVHTDRGLIRFTELFARANQGESFAVYTHDITNPDAPAERVELTRPDALMITGFNEIVRLGFDNGMQLRCTPNHRLFTTNRGYVEAAELTAEDQVKVLDLPTPAVSADLRLPIATEVDAYRQRGDHRTRLRLPEKWTTEFAHYLGWLVGDGSTTSAQTIAAFYGSAEDQAYVLPRHSQLVSWLNGDVAPRISRQDDGSAQQRLSRRAFVRFFRALGLGPAKGPANLVPWSVFQAPPEIVAAFLRGLFDADGCVGGDDAKGSYVGLGSASRSLLTAVQQLLATFGIASTICRGRPEDTNVIRCTRQTTGEGVQYRSAGSFDLRITAASIPLFASRIGFSLPSKRSTLASMMAERTRGFYRTDTTARLIERVDDGYELTYNLSEPRNHSYVVNGVIVRNCSEYMHLDNSACNLASLNLLAFLDEDGAFDVEGFKAATEVMFTAQEILVGNADYPTTQIAETSRRFRQLGIGYANLGALLMAQGAPYDSVEGRAWAAAITALLTGHAYATSGRIAARMGPYAGYTDNRQAMLAVLRMHRDDVARIDEERVPPELLSAAQESWDAAVEASEEYGVRNSQASVLAPTGTIGLLMDCDTTGIEPDLGLVKTKKLVGGGTMSIVNQTLPRALRRLGYTDEEIGAIVAYVDDHKSILGAPELRPEHLAVFACSMGDNTIPYDGHIRMMAAVQPWISGAISKTVNLPEAATVEEVEQLLVESWKLGLKAVAIYRDNCKVAQPLATAPTTGVESARSDGEAHDAELALKVAELERALQRQTVVVRQPIRERLPRRRRSSTFKFRVADCEGYVTVGEYEDGRPGELFIKVAKQGSTLAGIMDSFAISVSLGLQHGVPLQTFVKQYVNVRFEPAGMTDDPELRIAASLVDYIFRRLAVDYLPYEDRVDLGILTTGERVQPTLPGVEEVATQSSSIVEAPLGDDDLLDRPPDQRGKRRAAVPQSADAPYCYECGVQMQRAGSCFACPSCGTTSGCS